ncbi:hypothetical protein LO043_002882 [Salmonella enterica]|nr:hypothetical protein [Salmonella enterica]
MSTDNDKKKTKGLRIGFYTGSENMRSSRPTVIANAFEALYAKCESSPDRAHFLEFGERHLKIQFIEKDSVSNTFFGYISRKRNGAHLAYISDESWVEEKIPLIGSKVLTERTFFLYYPATDLLVLSLNHLGPKHNDLAYMLFNTISSPISFEAIWRQESIKELLETGSALRSCELSLAIPRNLNETSYDLSGVFAKQVIAMAKGTASSHLTLLLRGQSPIKKKMKGWLTADVKESIKELLEKFPSGDGGLEVEKADVVVQGDRKKKSLVDQVLTLKKLVLIQNDGYTADSDVKAAMIQAKLENSRYLSHYELPAS